MEINERIKKVRTDADLSLKAFGDRIGINASSVLKIEKGDNNPSEQTLRLISSSFKVSYLWLKDGEGEPYLPPDTDDELVEEVMAGENEFARKAFRVFARLSDAEWEVIRRIVNELKDEA